MKMLKRGKIWYADFYLKGKRYKKSLGTPNKTLAEKAFTKLKYEIEVQEAGLPFIKKTTFEAFAIRFLEWYKMQNAVSSFTDYKNLFHSTLIPYFGNNFLTDIDSHLIERYKIKRSKEIKSGTVNKELTALKTLFNRAIDWNYLNFNPLSKVKKLKVAETDFRFLTLDEIEKVLANCSRTIYPLILTAIHAGMRRKELFRLEWQDINFDNGYITVISKENEHTKNYKRRDIPLTQTLNECLKNLPKTGKHVFVKSDGSPYVSNITKSINQIIEKSGVDRFTLHDLRHTFASQLVMDGVDLATVQKLMGHSNIKTTMIYTHLAPEHLKLAISRLEKRLSGNKTGTVLKMPVKEQSLSS
jgi:integrase